MVKTSKMTQNEWHLKDDHRINVNTRHSIANIVRIAITSFQYCIHKNDEDCLCDCLMCMLLHSQMHKKFEYGNNKLEYCALQRNSR